MLRKLGILATVILLLGAVVAFNSGFLDALGWRGAAEKGEADAKSGQPSGTVNVIANTASGTTSVQSGASRLAILNSQTLNWDSRGSDIQSEIERLLKFGKGEDISYAHAYLLLCSRFGGDEDFQKRSGMSFEDYLRSDAHKNMGSAGIESAIALRRQYQKRCGKAIDQFAYLEDLVVAQKALKPDEGRLFFANRESTQAFRQPISERAANALKTVFEDQQLLRDWLSSNPSALFGLIDDARLNKREMLPTEVNRAAYLAICGLGADCSSQGQAYVTLCVVAFVCGGASIEESVAAGVSVESAQRIRALADEMIAAIRTRGIGAFTIKVKAP